MNISKKINLCHYDSGDDSLTFIGKSKDAEHTEDLGYFLISLNKNKEIVAMEILGIKKNFKVPEKVLKDLKKSEIEFNYNEENKILFITIKLFTEDKNPTIITNNTNSEFINAKGTITAIACS